MQIDRSFGRSLAPGIALLLLVLAASLAWAQGGPVQYGYDELGRLTVVVDGAGNAAIYNYDSVGNLLSIQRMSASEVLEPIAIFAIAPPQGPVGSTVSIFGKGFSATPAQNTVSFNGGLATVATALPTHLRVVVPPTAVNGPITVTTPAGSATSAQSFRVVGPLTVTPTGASVVAGTNRQYSAAGPGGTSPTVDWAVNNIPGGNANLGTISANGLYTVPASVAQQFLVTINATDQADLASKGSTAALAVPVGSQRSAMAKAVSVNVGSGPGIVKALAASVSASIGSRNVTNSLQATVSTVIAGNPNVTNSLQASVSAAVAANPIITNSLESHVSAVIGGHPSSTASTAISVSASPVIAAVSPTAGARGATGLTVTLTGIGFTDATQVTFLLSNAADTTITSSIVSSNSDGTEVTLQISVASGASTGARVVKIATPTGTSTIVGTGANTFTVQ